MSRSLVLLSGGIDSAAALAWAHRNSSDVIALSFEYHLRPFREKLASYRLLQAFPGRLIETPLPFLREAGDALSQLPAGIPEGYVSNRNLIFYSLAAHFAELLDCQMIVGGHTAEDQEVVSFTGQVTTAGGTYATRCAGHQSHTIGHASTNVYRFLLKNKPLAS